MGQLQVLTNKANRRKTKIRSKHGKFKEVVHHPRDSRQLQKDTSKILEELACTVYGSKGKSANQSRGYIFTEKCQNEKRIVLNWSVLNVNSKLSNYIAKLQRSSTKCPFQVPNLMEFRRIIHAEKNVLHVFFQNWCKTFCMTLTIALNFKGFVYTDVESDDEN